MTGSWIEIVADADKPSITDAMLYFLNACPIAVVLRTIGRIEGAERTESAGEADAIIAGVAWVAPIGATIVPAAHDENRRAEQGSE